MYQAVALQESAPSNLQVQRVTVLQQEVNKAHQSNETLTKTYYAKAKEALDKTAAIKKELKPKMNNEEIKK